MKTQKRLLALWMWMCTLALGCAQGEGADAEGPGRRGARLDAVARATGPIRLAALPSKCVEVRGASTANGAPVQIRDCDGTEAQAWSFIGGTVRRAGQCLDVKDG